MEVQNTQTGFDPYFASYNDDIVRSMAMDDANSDKDQEVWIVNEEEDDCNIYIEEYE